METHTYKHTHPHGTCTLSSRQQDPVSNQDRAWSRSMLRANDLRHMSSPCGFKTKACQEHSALAGQPAPYFAFPHMQQATQSSKLKTTPIINCVVLVGCALWWEKLLCHGWKKIRRTSRSRIKRMSAVVSLKQVTGQ